MQRLLNFMIALRRLPPLSELSGEEERMLFEMRQAWEYQGTLSVSDVYAMANGKSPSTAYRLAVALRDKGLVEIRVTEADKRGREITFTSKAEYLFQKLA
ncbi:MULTISPECIES: hypothetical protein [Pseudomonadota]|uniref:hypothetical protein n=1 Tax=Pseudomonadota TaxID=1224 RepID=UPI0022BF4D65|nr:MULTISPECIES: hypothetical protein [Pseudomonadota]MCZ8074463.1 hypothetical protein [Roseateles sp.]MCZ8095011.1 hypothetical protein [Acidovorax sp.]MCZ8227687.1 hypothetical protein [Burkholderiaceae bacterium]MCZ8017186.1 hypothetical protein [Limnobacter sp.]MCZ8233309.1 hypothetical protein [Novosphingobium sp.]